MATPKRRRGEQEDVITLTNEKEVRAEAEAEYVIDFIADSIQTVDNAPGSERALRIPELLEMILLQLPMKDLLLAQRVSKRWQHSIQSSINLRRALFLEPVSCGPVSYLDWRLDDKDCYTEADLDLGEHIRGPDRKDKPKIYPTHWGKTRDDAGRYTVFVNPLLAKLFPVLAADGLYWNDSVDDLPPASLHNDASWQWMLITQPPVKCMTVEWDCSEDEDTDADWTVKQIQMLDFSAGLNMDDVFKFLADLGHEAWIEGRHLWSEYTGSDDLSRVEQGAGK